MRVDEVRDQVLDAMREGVNAGVMATIKQVALYRHDSLVVTFTDGTEAVMRVVDIKETS